MAIWSSTSITNVKVGVAPNDGSGDDIRDAFIKVDSNFGNVSQWLADSYVEFQNANVDGTMQSRWANVINANVSNIYGNVNVSGTFLPIGVGFNIGTPSNRIGNIYAQHQDISTQVTNTSDNGLFLIHATDPSTDYQDTGIFGNIYNNYGSNTYSFFGHQYATSNFAYIITPTDATKGNNIVVGGVYGNAHFGSALLSNTTVGGNTLIVSGNTGIAGNLTAGGNLNIGGAAFADGGYRVITTNIVGNYGNPYTGGIISGNTVFLSSAVSTSANTGAVSIPYGGLGVLGNAYSATGFVSPKFYGVIQTADQPNITSLGTLPTLNVVSGGFTSIGTVGLTTTGIVNLSGPTLTIAGNTSINNFANIASGLIVGGNTWTAGTITAVGNLITNSNASITNAVNVGTTLTVGNAMTVGTSITLTNTVNSISSASPVTLDMFSATTYGSAKYLIQIVDTGVTPNKVETAEMTLVHDRNGSSTQVYVNTYGIVANQGSLGTFLGTYSSGAIRLQFTPSYTPTNMAIKVVRTAVTL
jgi:hypothetical protein